jgi:hypothetical protein
MDWKHIYERFITIRKDRILEGDVYTEEHHIVPRWCGGDGDPSNMIRLTAREHYLAHLMLAKAFGGRHWGAVWVLANAAPERFMGSARFPPTRTVAIYLEHIRKAFPEAAAKAVETKRASGTLTLAAQKAAATKAREGTHQRAGEKAAATRAAVKATTTSKPSF